MRQSQKSSKRKNRAELNDEGRERKRQRKHKGHAAGNRSNIAAQTGISSKRSSEKDPRIGSKKPISLMSESNNKTEPKEKPVKKTGPLSPEKELALLENDDKLDVLLERLENGEGLNASEQNYVDRTLDRINELMAILGIEFEDDGDENYQTEQQDIMRLLKQKD